MTLPFSHPLRNHRRPTAATGAVSCLHTGRSFLWRVILNWYRRRRDLRILQGLDDHLLKDIGLRRGNLVSAVYERDRHG
jgi:uncharacterized protein YjiS (DUF1127 family)